MIRKIRLYGTLEKVAGQKDFEFACDNQHQLFAGLRALCPQLDITMRQLKTFSICWTETEEEKNPKLVENGFRFSDRAKVLHISPSVEGAWWYVFVLIAAMVISYAIMRLTMPHMGNNQGQGTRSTMFNGPVNPTEQGNPIPKLCGKKVLFGAQVIAADEDYVNLV